MDYRIVTEERKIVSNQFVISSGATAPFTAMPGSSFIDSFPDIS